MTTVDEIDVIDEIEIEDADEFPLAGDEKQALERCEAVIARGAQTFIEVGDALAEIRSSKLYRMQFATFEDYCRDKWGIGGPRARQLIGAAGVAHEIESVTNVTLSNEGQARAVAKAPPSDRPEVLNRAVKIAGDRPLAAKHITQAAAELSAPDLPPEFAIVQRRYERHGYALASAWDGAVQRFVVRKDGGTGVVLAWDAVLSRLERLEGESVQPPTLTVNGVPRPGPMHGLAPNPFLKGLSSPPPPPAPDPATELEIKRLCAISGSRYLGIPTDLPYPTETRYRIALANHAGGGDYLADEALERLRAACTATENPPPPLPDPAPADNAAAWQYQEAQDASLLSTAQANIGIGNIGDARRLLNQVSDRSAYARDQLLDTLPAPPAAGRRITLELSPHDCAALLKESRFFANSKLTKQLPTIGQTLVLLVEAIKQP